MTTKEAAKKIAAAGKLLMYHNHNIEFQKVRRQAGDRHAAGSFAPDELGFTLDTYWVQMGGADVCGWIEKLADRIPCVHIGHGRQGLGAHHGAGGQGNLPWEKILATLEKCSKTKYLLVEQDVCQESPFTCLEKSYKYLNSLGYSKPPQGQRPGGGCVFPQAKPPSCVPQGRKSSQQN